MRSLLRDRSMHGHADVPTRLKLFLMHSHIISSHGARHYMCMRIPSIHIHRTFRLEEDPFFKNIIKLIKNHKSINDEKNAILVVSTNPAMHKKCVEPP